MSLIKEPVYRYIGNIDRFTDAIVSGFNPRFNAEDFTWLTEIARRRLTLLPGGQIGFTEEPAGYNQPSYLLIAMTSFCTITPADSLEHQLQYGSNTIQLSPDWATRNGLRPLIYLERDDVLTLEEKNNLILKLRKRPLPVKYICEKWPDISFWKPRIGAMPIREEDRVIGELSTIDDFFEEREIRFVPEIFLDYMELTHDIETTHKRMDELSKITAAFRLTFEDSDVHQIIVETEIAREKICSNRPGLCKKVLLWKELNFTSRIDGEHDPIGM